jgi:hypothetical protein
MFLFGSHSQQLLDVCRGANDQRFIFWALQEAVQYGCTANVLSFTDTKQLGMR